ncbi:MAG TPA: type IV-A pilus assembly ATPase PilB [Acidobacteriota bacterium]|nr:type IV-A pilus assembly ATPase PilB [Acidobacteriota bacterium]
MTTRIGEVLIQQGLLNKEQLNQALAHQRKNGGRLGSTLSELGYCSDLAICQALSKQYDVPSIELKKLEIDPEVIGMVPVNVAIRYQLVPVKRVGTTLTVAVADPSNIMALDEIKFMTGLRVEPVIAMEGDIREAIEQHYGDEHSLELQKVYDELSADADEYELELSQDEDLEDLDALQRDSEEAPIIKLVNLILAEAIRKGASDIHIEPYEKEFRVRYRIDGALYIVMNPPIKFRDAIISRVKIMANLDISERRLPQDGRIKMRISQHGRKKEIDLRVSSLPTLFGEKIVMRILDATKLPLDLTRLGFEPESLRRFERAADSPYGMILVTGPTGSGKSSTLYTCLNRLNAEDVNIMTAEDPVEFNFPGINQVQTKEQVGLTFAAALRSFLRQDPDIIMVGEIRDLDTAEISIKAAQTGHLVLSTLHTNDAPSAITRMLDMGIAPFLVTSSVNLVCAQRLVRRICKDCKEEMQTPVSTLIEMGFPPPLAKKVTTYHGKGCSSCNESGYKGRIGLYEVMEVTPAVRQLILSRDGFTVDDIRKKAIEEGMITLRESGLKKVGAGVTTVDEVLRETAGEH